MKYTPHSLFFSLLVGAFPLWVACSDDPAQEIPIPPPVTPLPAEFSLGVTTISDDSLQFVLQAPGKKEVHLIGDFTDWDIQEKYRMHQDGDYFWIRIGNLTPGKEYVCQYVIDQDIRIADPFAHKISDPYNDKHIPASIYPNLIKYPSGMTSKIAMVVNTQPEEYKWKVEDFRIEDPEDLVIYELLIRDFTTQRSIKEAMGKLDYLQKLGVTAIQLMPFNEFEGNESWGYNPSFFFATDKAYGTTNDYKAFIDACHQRGMAVIMDMVLNHSFGQSPMVRMYQNKDNSVAADNPWYNERSNFENPDAQWGYDFNHESTYTKQFVDSVCNFWLTEFKLDGFRFDFTKGFSNKHHPASGNDSWGSLYDGARIANLKRIYDFMQAKHPGALMICEHLAENKEEKELANYGIYLWGNMNYNFNETTMGWLEGDKDDLTWGAYPAREWEKPTLVTYMESHDEERIMFKNLQYGNSIGNHNVKNLATALHRTEAAAVILMSIPGPKMIWQFGELGYDYELNDDRLAPKPVRWDYYDQPDRRALYDTYASINKLRTTHPAFSSSQFTTHLKEDVKVIELHSPGKNVVVVANFAMQPKEKTVDFGVKGMWHDHFSKQVIDTQGDITQTLTLQPGEYRVYLLQ